MIPFPPKAAVRPRPAAGVVLLRGGKESSEVLLGRRSARLRFMPGYYVFPGGGLEPTDHRLSGFVEPPPEDFGSKIDDGTRELMAALRRAALREVWEETGLLIGRISQEARPRVEPQEGVWQEYRKFRLQPAFSSLQYIARAITPATSPIRFHSRFFLCQLDDLTLAGKLLGDGELEDLRWRRLDALEHLPMADVTRAVLAQALRRQRDPHCAPCLFSYRRGALRRA